MTDRHFFSLGEFTVALAYIFLPLILGSLHGSWKKSHKIHSIFSYYLGFSVGVQGLITGLLQILAPQMVTSFTEWNYSPFLIELGMANLAFGFLGLVSFWLGEGGKLAAALGYGLFLVFTGIGHIIRIAKDGLSPGDAGGFLLSDFVGGIAIIVFAILSYATVSKSDAEHRA